MVQKDQEDISLVDLVLQGDVSAFSEIVLRYEKAIITFIYNMVGSIETAEDLTQETFISVYNKLYTFNKKYKFSTWIFQIAKNKTIDYSRKHGSNGTVRYEDMELFQLEESAINSLPESSLEFKETKEQIRNFIKTLSKVDKQILILRFSYSELTFLDIAKIVKLSEAAVKKRYYKTYKLYNQFIKNGGKEKKSMSKRFSMRLW